MNTPENSLFKKRQVEEEKQKQRNNNNNNNITREVIKEKETVSVMNRNRVDKNVGNESNFSEIKRDKPILNDGSKSNHMILKEEIKTMELKELNQQMNENKENPSLQTKFSYDIKNVLTYAYLPVCLEKMKEGEYVYKWNNNNIFQKKSLKFFYLDVNNYCLRWNSKKKKLKENNSPILYIGDIVKIMDGSDSPFFKKKESDKNLSIEIVSAHRNLRLTFLDIQRWKMWLFGLMYYQYKLSNNGNIKKTKLSVYENNKIYDNYIISGLKDINNLTLSQLYIILRSLNVYLNMKNLYHYFSMFKDADTINYEGFTKILNQIFSNSHISKYFKIYKEKNHNYLNKKGFLLFLIQVQNEGTMEEAVFNNPSNLETLCFWKRSNLGEEVDTTSNRNQGILTNEISEISKQRNDKIHEQTCREGMEEKETDRRGSNNTNLCVNNNMPIEGNMLWNIEPVSMDDDYIFILQMLNEFKQKKKKHSIMDEEKNNEEEETEEEEEEEEEEEKEKENKDPEGGEYNIIDDQKERNYSEKKKILTTQKNSIQARVLYKILHFIKKFNSPFVIINEPHYLTEMGLIYFLYSKENSIMCPTFAKVYQNMDLPLCNYWINSSHNSYLARKQIFSSSNIEQYIYILIDGCRCVEFDCYYINKNIVVYHGFYGYKLTSSILFCEALIACKMFAFTFSPYPVILSLEIHCKNKHKNLIAKILISVLGNQLYIPKTTEEIINITPNKCKYRFLVKYKHCHGNRDGETNGDNSFCYLFEGLQNILYDEISNNNNGNELSDDEEEEEEDEEDENLSEEKAFDMNKRNTRRKKTQEIIYGKPLEDYEKHKNSLDKNSHEEKEPQSSNEKKNLLGKFGMKKSEFSGQESKLFNYSKSFNNRKVAAMEEKKRMQRTGKIDPLNNLLNEYSCLKGYVFKDFYETRGNNEICSISENKFIKLIKKHEKEIIRYNQRTLTRVYPSGTRLASTNFNPLIFWNAGIQVVALNYQYNGLSMLLNKGRFLENGGKNSGYILKPRILMTNEKKDYCILNLNLQILSLHQMNILFSIKNKHHEKKLKRKLFQMNMKEKIRSHKKMKHKMKYINELQIGEKGRKGFPFSDIQSDDNKNNNTEQESFINKLQVTDNEVNYINNKFQIIEQEYEDMLSEYKSYLLCSSFSNSSSSNSCSSNSTSNTSLSIRENQKNNESELKKKQEFRKEPDKEKFNFVTKTNMMKRKIKEKTNMKTKSRNNLFYQTFEELKKANNTFFYLYVTVTIHGYNEQKYYFKTEIAKVNFYDLNYCWENPLNIDMKICNPSLALIVFELKTYDTVKSEVIASACFPVKCLRDGIRFVPLCDKYLKDIKGSGILVHLKSVPSTN